MKKKMGSANAMQEDTVSGPFTERGLGVKQGIRGWFLVYYLTPYGNPLAAAPHPP